ncbi:MAG: RNA methyltransferase [Propionibacteriaceae bacterium]|jgi:TrmH family RNA methyltransferase|nr:RNA methyltransferase [Propionibacteriaceae bacterium]
MVEISAARMKLARRLLNRKFRAERGEFLVEGAQAVREAVTAGAALHVLATSQAALTHPDIVEDEYNLLSEAQARELADTVTTQGLFAICSIPEASLSDVVGGHLVMVCAQIRDPGNLGTVIRCADAFGASGVVLTTGCVDWTNPKTVRASVGSVFHLPLVVSVSLEETVSALRDSGHTVLAADGVGEDLNDLADAGGLAGQVTWVMGNEAWGLPEEERNLADKVVRIPMWGNAESLNLSTAAAICLYATASAQHRGTGE